FRFPFASRCKADRQPNSDSESQRAKDGRHGIFAYEIFSALSRPARCLFRLVPRLAHGRGNLACCLTKLLTPTRANLFFARLNRRRQRFVPRKIVFVRINHTKWNRSEERRVGKEGRARRSAER